MSAAPYIFPAQQAEFLRALRDGRYRAPARTHNVPASSSLISRMPPIYEQALRGTCVSNAVTAMLEYYEDCKMRLSVQYLFAATKEVERAAIERNLSRLRIGEALDPEFEHAHHSKLLQLRMMADANGGINTPVMRPYLTQFEETVRKRYEAMDGCLLRSCFNVLEYRGTCRYALWPYAGVSAAPLFGSAERVKYPPGSDEDAKKHRILSGLYLLPAPNNVDEIRGILAGVNDRRPMPVCVTVSFFKGCDGETFTFPCTEETPDGLAAKDAWLGVHGMLIVGYVDNAAAPGGGYFIVRNSQGEAWGNRGYGKLPYAYVACFALEAGTILQDLVDYTGDGYGGLNGDDGSYGPPHRRRRGLFTFVNILVAAALVAGTWMAVKWYLEQRATTAPVAPNIPPYAEVTVYGRSSNVDVTLPPPWDGVKGEPIDGGVVFRLPVKTHADVDAIRKTLDAEPTLREKRGKPLTYDIVSFFDLVADDLDAVRKTIGMFAAEHFLVRIKGESNGVLRVSTVSPPGLRARLKEVFRLEDLGKNRLALKPIPKDEPVASPTASPPETTGVPLVEDTGTTGILPVETTPDAPSLPEHADPAALTTTNAVLPIMLLPPASPETNALSVVVRELDHPVSNAPLVVVHGRDSSEPDAPAAVAQERDSSEPDAPAAVVQERDPPVTNTSPTVYSVTDMPSSVVSVTEVPAPIVSVTDVPKPSVVSVTDSEQVVIVGTNGVIARFGRAVAPRPPKSEDMARSTNTSHSDLQQDSRSVAASNTLPAKIEKTSPVQGEPSTIRQGTITGNGSDF